jgi:hypothetical protein
MKKPSDERGPKLNSAIAQPQAMMMSGVRQLTGPDAGRGSPVVDDINCLSLFAACAEIGRVDYNELMHLHGNPRLARKIVSRCSDANQRGQMR